LVTIRNHNIVLDGEFTRHLNPKVLYQLGKISEEDQIKFQELYQKKERSLKVAFICLMFFPCTHYAFVGKWQLQILFWVTLGGGLVWWVADFFRIKQLIRHKNHSIQKQVLRDVHSINIFDSINTKLTNKGVAVKMADKLSA